MVIKGVICGIPSNTTGANILSQVYTILLKKKKKKEKKKIIHLKFLEVLHFISTGKNS